MGLQVILEAYQSGCISDTIRQIVPEFRCYKREGSVFKPVLVLWDWYIQQEFVVTSQVVVSMGVGVRLILANLDPYSKWRRLTGYCSPSQQNWFRLYSGPCDERPPLLRSQDGLSWGCGLISGRKMYTKYYLVRTRGLSSQGPLYIYLGHIQGRIIQ